MNNNEGHSDLCIGIDLGTTNSVLACVNLKPNGDIVSKVVELPRPVDTYDMNGVNKYKLERKPTLPSYVFYDQANNYRPIVGNFAKNMYFSRPDFTAKSIKSQMGKERAEGLADGIPDKTPAQISSRILKHMLAEAGKIFKQNITDAVITVPANFDSVMCQATLEAAALAGITVKNADGAERPVLLSEPNAVIWDFINQVKNGDINQHIIDMSEPKDVMVFDLGGGTLDITLHHIERRADNPEIIKVSEIATNRYTRLGGDDFDFALAKSMYARYLAKYQSADAKSQDAQRAIKNAERAVMSQLLKYAEEDLKLALSNRKSSEYVASAWDDDEFESDDAVFEVGGNIAATGYSYGDTFTQQEIEDILRPFMGEGLKFEDYKNFDEILNDQPGPNIILPVLDVLNKAAKKLNDNNIKDVNVNVDAVILNGGMTQFYMVADRLKEFFGFEPIAALDPDQAVARGAAVYHYYLHKYNELEEDMRRVQVKNAPAEANNLNNNLNNKLIKAKVDRGLPIEWGSNILNDSLYLAMKNGVPEEIIPTGAELPYESAERTGFRLPIGANNISVPIQRRDNFGGAYLTIASGRVNFKRSYNDGAYVSFKVFMNKSKIITMRAALSADLEGQEQLEEREAVIDVGAGVNKLNKLNNLNNINLKNKVLPPLGSELNAEAELHTISQLCSNYAKAAVSKKSRINKQINDIIELLKTANNKNSFGQAFLKALRTERNEYCKLRFLITARRICSQWPDEERAQLAAFCLSLIQGELNSSVSLNISNIPVKEEAIRALALCGDKNMLDRLAKLHDIAKFRTALVFAHSRTATQPDWLLKVLIEDYKNIKRGIKSSIGDTANALCCMFRKYPDNNADRETIIKFLHDAVKSNMLNDNELISCTLAIGAVCAKQDGIEIDNNIIAVAQAAIDKVYDLSNSSDTVLAFDKAINIARNLIAGTELAKEEQEFLLERIDKA